MRVDDFLSRLEKVRGGDGRWMACCPAHADKTPSLTIAEGSDGKVLVHCFGGCAVDEIVQAMGLKLPDIMPDSRPVPMTMRQRIPASEALEAMAINATVVAIMACDMAKGRALTSEEKDKLLSIAGELQEAVEVTGSTRIRDGFLSEVRKQ